VSTFRPVTFTSYDSKNHTSVSKTVFTGIKFATDDVDDFVLRGTPAPSTLVFWGSPDLSFSVSEITQDDGEVVHQIGLATGELYAMARDGLFINTNDAFGESFLTDQMFVDITASSLDGVSRLSEMTVDNTDLQQEVIYLYSIAGDEIFDGQTPSAQELEAFVTDVETNGSYGLSDLTFATPSEAPLATTTVITDMPTNNYEWADEYYDYLWNPLNDDRVSNGSVNLTISASNLLAGETWAVSLPIMTQPDGETNFGFNRIDFWIDINTDDLFVQISDGQDGVAGTMRVENYYELFPSESKISDFWDLIYHPLHLIDFVTPFGNGTDTINRVPFKDVSKLPAPDLWDEDYPQYTANSFRDMLSFDNSSGEAVFAELNHAYTGGAFESNFISEPGNTTYISGPNLESWYFKGDIRYGNAPDAITVDFAARKVLEDGWGYTDDFTQWDWPHIDGSSFGDEFFNISEASIGGQYGDDWFHSFDAGGSFIGVGRGSDFVDATAITSTSANPRSATIVRLTADEVWGNDYYAFNASDANHVGTGDLISLDGYRQIQDVIFGSAEGYIRIEIENAYDFNNSDNKGIALFSDDIFAERHVEAGQLTEARLKDIAEIHATHIDDIIDLSSSRHADSVGEVKIYGLDGDDILWGGSSNESLDGGNGADVINGGAGNDILTGGLGSDIFEFTSTSGNDTIIDFSFTDDKLRIYSTTGNDNTWTVAGNTFTWGAVNIFFDNVSTLQHFDLTGLVEFQVI
jgi:Ca2+-binding RTX toxin-like protein